MRVVAVLVLLGSLLPLANWIPGGEVDAEYAARLADWALGLGLCAGVGGLAWFVMRGRAAPLAPASASSEAATPAAHETRWTILIALGALVLYLATARWVFSGRPLLIDEMVQVLQARDLAAGRLTHALQGPASFFAIMHEVVIGDRAFGQYPVGGPAMLVPGVLLGAEWIVMPVVGALCVLLFAGLVRALEPEASPRFRLRTTALFALAPFGVFVFGSHMNHASGLLWILAAAYALSRATRATEASPLWGLLAGLALGAAAAIRPLDGAAFALPAAVWLAAHARTGRRGLASFVLSGVGVAVPMGLTLWANARTTGHAFTFGYDLLWGPTMAIGFHPSPWGPAHTPQRGLELLSLYLTRLNTNLFELPFPSLLLPAVGLWASRRLTALDRYLLAGAALIGLGYWAYWHDGNYLGPRFLFPWLPLLVLWSARGVRAMAMATATDGARRAGFVGAAVVAGAYALLTLTAVRVPLYRNGLPSLRMPHDLAARAGVRDALVLVQESWGAQLVVRLWEIGVTRPDAEALYRSVDACRLEQGLAQLERDGVRGAPAFAALQPMMRDSAQTEMSRLSPDATERHQAGIPYTPTCITRIQEDRAGYLLYPPWRLVQDGNVYARWLPGRESEIRAAFPDRPVYRLRRAGTSVDAPYVWERLSE